MINRPSLYLEKVLLAPGNPWDSFEETEASLLTSPENESVTEDAANATEADEILDRISKFSLRHKDGGVRLLDQRVATMRPEEAERCRALFGRLSTTSWARGLSDEMLITMSGCSVLETLDAERCKLVTDEGICAVARVSRGALVSLYLSKTHITDTSLFVVAEQCLNLKVLDVSRCKNISDKGVCSVMRGLCKKTLTWLDLKGTEISDETLFVIAKKGKRLQGLDLSECAQITDVGLGRIMSKCSALRTLYLRRCVKMVGDGLADVPESGSSLEELVLTECPYISPSSLATFAKHCPHLEMVHLYDVPAVAAALATLAFRVTQLARLVLAHCHTINDQHLGIIGKYCSCLECLNISGCAQITDKGVSLLTRLHTQLVQIDLSSTQVQDKGIACLAERCTELTGIAVERCQITDNGAQALALSCTKLRELRLSGTAISDAGICAIAKRCTSLTSLALDECKIGDDGVQAVALACTNLRDLRLSHTAVSDFGLAFIAAYNKQLEKVRLDGCGRVTDVGFDVLKKSIKNIEFIR